MGRRTTRIHGKKSLEHDASEIAKRTGAMIGGGVLVLILIIIGIALGIYYGLQAGASSGTNSVTHAKTHHHTNPIT